MRHAAPDEDGAPVQAKKHRVDRNLVSIEVYLDHALLQGRVQPDRLHCKPANLHLALKLWI